MRNPIREQVLLLFHRVEHPIPGQLPQSLSYRWEDTNGNQPRRRKDGSWPTTRQRTHEDRPDWRYGRWATGLFLPIRPCIEQDLIKKDAKKHPDWIPRLSGSPFQHITADLYVGLTHHDERRCMWIADHYLTQLTDDALKAVIGECARLIDNFNAYRKKGKDNGIVSPRL